MTGDLAIYLIFYGSWDRRNQDNVRTMNVLTHLAKYIGSSSWMDTNRQYYQEGKGDRQYADGSITYKGSVILPSDGKTSLNDEDMSGEPRSDRCGDAGLLRPHLVCMGVAALQHGANQAEYTSQMLHQL